MAEGLKTIRSRLRTEGAKVVAFFSGLPEEDWDRQVYRSGSGWTVRGVLAHFVSAERAFAHYMRRTMAGGEGPSRDFDIDAFNQAEVASLRAKRPAVLLDAFRKARAEMLSLVAELQPDDLAHPGFHPWFGDTVLEKMLKLVYRHNMIHLRDIRRSLDHGAPTLPRA